MKLFATAVNRRIAHGEPIKKLMDTSTFAEVVDKHIDAFQPYLDLTGIGLVLDVSEYASIAAVLCQYEIAYNESWRYMYSVSKIRVELIASAICAGVTVDTFKRDAEASCKLHSTLVPPTDDQIQQMAEDCRDYADLLQDTMPHECALARNFDWVRSNLFTLA